MSRISLIRAVGIKLSSACSFPCKLITIRIQVKKRKKNKRRREADEAGYVCPTCGEQIVIPIDPSGGLDQQYVEDCPVCCNPNVIHVEFFGGDEPPRIWADAE